MKKFLKKTIAVVLTAMMVMAVGQPAFAKENSGTELKQADFGATLTNLETGEMTVLNVTEISEIKEIATYNTRNFDGSVNKIVGVKVELELPKDAMPRKVTGDYEGGGGVEAYLYVDYTYKTVGTEQYVRVNKVYGSWEATSQYITFSNRRVNYGDGDPNLNTGSYANKIPSGNRFEYVTGWDYIKFYPATEYSGARAHSQITASMSGGSNYLVECFVRVESL